MVFSFLQFLANLRRAHYLTLGDVNHLKPL
jgi:hypothetical protein